MAHLIRLPMLLLLVLLPVGSARSFLGRPSGDLLLDVHAVRQELDSALRGALGQGHGVSADQIKMMNATLLPMFRTLPQNAQNRVAGASMRYMVQRYFSVRHGWVIKGFEPHANRSSQGHEDAGILRSKVPGFIESVLEKDLLHGGFALEDVLTVIIVLERLIFDEVIQTVENAYALNGLQHLSGFLGRDELMNVLESYVIVEMLERHEISQEEHDDDKVNILELYPNWPDVQLLIGDIVDSETDARQHVTNPFNAHSFYSFEDAARIAQRFSNEIGQFGNQECLALQDALTSMDRLASGRVPLANFYRGLDDQDWGFHESTEYLRQLGSLDESSTSRGPQVIIPNYVYGMSNCLSSTPFYSICCLNQCEEVLQTFEGHLAEPAGTPTAILEIAERLVSPGNISAPLRAKLSEVAAHHGGNVPVHGRLFAQWLHHVFPYKCPFPHVAGTVKPVTQSEWKDKGQSILIEESERESYLAAWQNVTSTESEEDPDLLWSMDEEILMSPEPQGPRMNKAHWGTCWQLLPSVVAMGLLVLVARLQVGVAGAAVRRLSTLKSEAKLEHKSHLV